MKELDINIAKARIWNRLKNNLPDRGISVYQNELSALRLGVEQIKISRLKKVQSKESLLDILPDRFPAKVPQFLPRKTFAFATLIAFFSVFLVPVLRFAPSVSAMPENTLQVVEGAVYVNGDKVIGTATLQAGDKIVTGEDAMAHVTFVDDSRLTMGPSTSINIVSADFDAENRALTRVSVYQETGRTFSQVINLVSSDAFFEVDFSGGYVSTAQKSSFDINIDDTSTTIMVARNFVNTVINSGDGTYFGLIGQGALLSSGDTVSTAEISSDMAQDVWWTFNMAYSKSYARQLDENYKQENIDRALILPGNPLYFLKTFRESVQISFALTDSAKTDLLVEQAESRLNEAQTLIAQGNTELAKETLNVYQETVDRAIETSGGEENQKLIALIDETQKEVAVTPSLEEGDVLLQSQLGASSLDAGFTSASQKLQQVPELIDAGLLDEAVSLLSDYQNESMSLLSLLQDVPMEDRDAKVSELLELKLSDLQMIRVIASLPELQGEVDTRDAILNQLSVMVLSLRERELKDLSDFFDADSVDMSAYDLYTQVKDSSQIGDELSNKLDTVEAQIATPTEDVVVDIEPVVDPRFSDSHTDQSED